MHCVNGTRAPESMFGSAHSCHAPPSVSSLMQNHRNPARNHHCCSQKAQTGQGSSETHLRCNHSASVARQRVKHVPQHHSRRPVTVGYCLDHNALGLFHPLVRSAWNIPRSPVYHTTLPCIACGRSCLLCSILPRFSQRNLQSSSPQAQQPPAQHLP